MNLSQQKRQHMLEFLEQLKSEYSDESSLSVIHEIREEILGKKYGLVWEKHQERADMEMETQIPVFKEVLDKEIKGSRENQYNFILEGDNLHTLRLLRKTHREKVDVIYIDPPYNTGGRDFMYDDCFVDKSDGYRHSKWLSFMDERLSIAKELMSRWGVIFISIDDNEFAPLKMLCDEIFGESNFIANIIWQKKTGASDAKGLATITEYILVYMKDSSGADEVFCKNYEAHNIKRYRFTDEYVEERGPYYLDSLDRGSVRYSDSLNYGIEAPDGTMLFPNGRTHFEKDGWTWKWSKAKVDWGIENGFIEIVPSKKKASGWAVKYKIYLYVDNEGRRAEKSAPFKNMITSVLNADAAAEIKGMFDGMTVFKYSKPVNLIKALMGLIRDKDCLVLDFFAGSGTTGQAVLEMNKSDHGHRKFLLCTNNENHICEEITYKRIEKTITGYQENGKKQRVKGTGGNLKYYRTQFIPRNEHKDMTAQKFMESIPEMMQLEQGSMHYGMPCEYDLTTVSGEMDQEKLKVFLEKYFQEDLS